MNNSRITNTLRNTRWGVLQKFLNVFLPFIVRTILIYSIGAEYAGLNSLFVSVLAVLSLAELGFSNAIVYSMYKPVAEGNKSRICALLAVYRKAYRVIGTIILVLSVIVAPFLPSLIQSDLPGNTNLYYFIYIADLVIGYYLYGYQTCLLSVHQREDIVSRNALIAGLFLRTLQCAVLLLLRSYFIFIILIPIATILQNLLNHYSVKRLYPDLIPKGEVTEEEREELKKNVVGLTIWKLGSATRNTFDSIVLSTYLGLISVAIYNNYMMIVGGISSLLGVISHSMLASVGNKIAVESPEENYKDFRKFHFLYMWLAGWCTICLMCLFQPFMKQWMGKSMMISDGTMLLFCYLFFMLKQGDVNSVYYQAAGLWWQGKWRSVIEAGSNLILNLILGKIFGLVGILLATIVSYTIAYFYGSRFTFTCYFRNKGVWTFYLDNLKYLLVTAGCGWITLAIVRTVSGMVFSGILRSLLCLIVCFLVPNALFLLVYGFAHREWLLYAYHRILRRKD